MLHFKNEKVREQEVKSRLVVPSKRKAAGGIQHTVAALLLMLFLFSGDILR